MYDSVYVLTVVYVSSDAGSSAYSKRLVFHQVRPFAVLALLVQKYVLTGTKVQIPTPEALLQVMPVQAAPPQHVRGVRREQARGEEEVRAGV
jgi:hypothetical protein